MIRAALVMALITTFSLFCDPAAAELSTGASIDGLSSEERAKLLDKKSITRSTVFRRSGRRYIVGISYQIVDMGHASLLQLMQDVGATLPRALPATHKARFVGQQGDLPLVEVVHGNSLINGGYTVVWQPVPSENEIRFWMDPTRPHDLADIWGYFRITPFGRKGQSMVTVAVALDLGSGATQQLYESKVRKVILKSARYIRKFVDRMRVAHAG